MNLPNLTNLNLSLEAIKPHASLGVSIRLDSDTMDGEQIEEALTWFANGGKLTSHWCAYDKKTGFRAWQLERGFISMYVGSSDNNRKERKSRSRNWMAEAMGALVQDSVDKAHTEKRQKLMAMGRTFFQDDSSLLAEARKRIGKENT